MNKFIKNFKNYIKENYAQMDEDTNENILTKIIFDDENLFIKLISDGGFENFLYAETEDGESYLDISTNLEGNMLLNAIWVKKGGIEEKLADLLKDFLDKTSTLTKNGFNEYIKYDLK